jgi:hypothetical protein
MIWAECSKTVPNAAARGRGRVEMPQGRKWRAEAGGHLPADVQRKSLLDSTYVAKISKIGLPRSLLTLRQRMPIIRARIHMLHFKGKKI